LIRRSSVDFPAPERPMMPMKLPGSNSSETSDTATIAPKRRDIPWTANIPLGSLRRMGQP
jgi:hypothetical protein